MRIFFNPLIKLMAVFAAIGILAACGENDLGDSNELMYDYCVYDATERCLSGPFKECQSGGLLSNSCPYQDAADGSSSSITTGGGTSSSSSIGGGTNYSLDGIWEISGGEQVTFSGSTGIINSFGSPSARTQDAINKGYIKLGDQGFKSITSTGNLTWSGQYLAITLNSSSPNVALGTQWINCTITMSSNGQTIDVAFQTIDGSNTDPYTRSTYKLDGVWEISGGEQVTFSGSTGIIKSFGSPSARTQDAINKGYIKLGDQVYKSLTSTGNLTWSGQYLAITMNSSSPNVALGTQWINCTITMSSNGQTIDVAFQTIDGSNTDPYTRKQ